MHEVHGRARLPSRPTLARPPHLRSGLRFGAWRTRMSGSTRRRAARYINLPVRSIYRLIHDGRLEAVRFPVRVRRHELDACLERCRIRPGEVAHLNAYPGGASRLAEPPLTKQAGPIAATGGGTEQSPGACGGLPRWVRPGRPCRA